MRRMMLLLLLVGIWLLFFGWQAVEHQRFKEFSQKGLTRRAHDLSAALSVVIRSQGRIAVIPKDRLEAALEELVSSTELESVVLLNESGEVAASAGQEMTANADQLLKVREHWSTNTASFANLVALGPGAEGVGGRAAILPLDLPKPGQHPGRNNEAGGPPPGDRFDVRNFLDNLLDARQRQTLHDMLGNLALTEEQTDVILDLFQPYIPDERRKETLRRVLVGRPLDEAALEELQWLTFGPAPPPDAALGPGPQPPERGEALRPGGPPDPSSRPGPRMRPEGWGRRFGPPPERPHWMNKEEYEQLVEERGVHWFLVSIPTASLRAELRRDLLLRAIVLTAALFACIGLAWAWRGFERAAALQMQLLKAQETSNRLQELNITAAGLVHETKNPLNLIRGFAQMIGREAGLSEAARRNAATITEEADRIAGRINQFLNYARPPHPQPGPVPLNAMVESLFNILSGDCEEKGVAFTLQGPRLCAWADEDMTRQALFNLLLNAVQAVPHGGRVDVVIHKDSHSTACLEVCDNGPGVPESMREEVFRPYVTAAKNGAGLGLAVVRRIAQAHGWTAACMPAQQGACFSLSNINLVKMDASHDATA